MATALSPAPGGLSRRERFEQLLAIYRLGTAPPVEPEPARQLADPAVVARKWAMEQWWLAELDGDAPPAGLAGDGPARALRRIAAAHRQPPVYRWLATQADRRRLVQFLALEGGPDAGFDDLVAVAQVGLEGPAKRELARNYWDEMGNGSPAAEHRALHRRMLDELAVPPVCAASQPEEALERAALDGLLATNRWLQPELLGALGMTELQAGPRCRMVLRAFDRLGVPDAAAEFYRVHADVDPRHGRDWLDNAVTPLVERWPQWGPRIVRGGWWRARVNARFFAAVERRLRAQEDTEH